MFTELKPLIDQRPLTITVAALREDQIRVNVVPQSLPRDDEANSKIKYSNKNEIAEIPDAAIKALTTPLSLTGTPAEIDANLARVLAEYTQSHVQLAASFDSAKKEIDAAAKAIDEREKNKPKKTGSSAKPAEKQEKPEEVGLLPLWCKPKPEVAGSDGSLHEEGDSTVPALQPDPQPKGDDVEVIES